MNESHKTIKTPNGMHVFDEATSYPKDLYKTFADRMKLYAETNVRRQVEANVNDEIDAAIRRNYPSILKQRRIGLLSTVYAR